MQTPQTEAGRLTERIMMQWLHNLTQCREPQPSVKVYNAAYEAVLEVLDEEMR